MDTADLCIDADLDIIERDDRRAICVNDLTNRWSLIVVEGGRGG